MIKKLNSFFFKLDQLIFAKIDVFKNSYLNIKWVGHSFHMIVLVSPIFLMLFIHFYSTTLEKEIKVKKDIFLIANQIINIDKDLQKNRRFILSNLIAANPQEFEQGIIEIVRSLKIKNENISIQNTQTLTVASSYNQISATIQFKGISITELTQLLSSLHLQQKMKIADINVQKDLNNSLLNGKILVDNYNEIANSIGE